jgi:hypothetical protein
MDVRFGTWNVRSLYRAGSLKAVAEEISKYKLDLVGVQDVRLVIPCEVIQIGRSTIKKNILYTYFYIFSFFKIIFQKILVLSVLPVQPFL